MVYNDVVWRCCIGMMYGKYNCILASHFNPISVWLKMVQNCMVGLILILQWSIIVFTVHFFLHKCSNKSYNNSSVLRTHKHPFWPQIKLNFVSFFLGHPLKFFFKNLPKINVMVFWCIGMNLHAYIFLQNLHRSLL